MSLDIMDKVQDKFTDVGQEQNSLVMRLLTTEEIDFVAGGDTTHAMGLGSSYSQTGGSFAQGAFSSYNQTYTAPKADKPPPPANPN